jgi:hypothetical protein
MHDRRQENRRGARGLEKAGAQVAMDDRATPQYLGEFIRPRSWAALIKASGVTVE